MKSLLRAKDLTLVYPVPGGVPTKIGPVNFSIAEGEAVGLLGESGAGKSTLGFEILGLLGFKGGKRLGGQIEYEGLETDEIAFIPQDPLSALDPLFSIGSQLREMDPSGESVFEVLRKVHLPLETISLKSYPHELSGGMRQRLVIAMALLRRPKLIIADEPTSSLDMILQAGILELFRELHKSGIAFLFITHHLPLAANFCSRMIILREGQIVEEGESEKILQKPGHPYTRLLMDSVPVLPL